ncbi:MAG: undecaprenyl-diphosphate phosphatase [candidate division Zixibacteria bacterium]|nr:undecaprenyl-diphosphate phosphatase [candidate division Zixibacteria bacterium]MDH3936352.1 undecaprenyl-diphosphate phosphatase [candidate division Zixibacteria bacterium]MDH4035452.1 undecaprenyl-diphosphate phosphatase [candidate division Zixibacteria bacterium]
MTWLDAAILGLLQGLTEFLPVSSSGHLVLAQALLGVKQPGMSFEILVHVGSLVAVLIYFRVRLFKLVVSLFNPSLVADRRVVWYLIVATIPAGVLGVLFEDFFAEAFSQPVFAGWMLIVTAIILMSTRWATRRARDLTWHPALIMGVAQALAILPGISRSGSTISAGLHAGIKPAEAAEFSFLLAIPAIGGATLLKLGQLFSVRVELLGQYMLGASISFVTSLVAVYLVLAVLRRGKFEYFAYYCFVAGGVGLYLFL